MTETRLRDRYDRIADQLDELFRKTDDPVARMATTAALLHHKMPAYFWTGFYLLKGDDLVVGPYQGPLACSVLKGPEGVCWAGMNRRETVIVPDVEAFPGHVACDSRSRSEIVVPLRDAAGEVVGVLDVDSTELDSFGETDAIGLERIVTMIHTA